MNRKLCILLVAVLIAPGFATAYKPDGWTYSMWPYSYDSGSQDWLYFNEGDSQWCAELSASGTWSELGSSSLAAGWIYWQWPYAFGWDSGAWFYLNESDTQWCTDLSSGEFQYGSPPGRILDGGT